MSFASLVEADFDRSTGIWLGDVAPAPFSDLCSESISQDRRSGFSAELDAADQALAVEDMTAAKTASERAFGEVYRGGGDTEIWVKCLGESDDRRWFETQLALDRLKMESDFNGPGYERERLRIAAIGEGSPGGGAFVENRGPRKLISALGWLMKIIERLDADEKFGALLLPEEEEIRVACRDALIPLRERATEEHRQQTKRHSTAHRRNRSLKHPP